MVEIFSNIMDLLNGSSNILNDKCAQALVDILPVGIVIANPAGNIVYANHEAYAIFSDITLGTTNKTELRYSFFDLVGNAIPFENIPLYRTLEDGRTYKNFEILVRFFNGNERYISISSSPIVDENNTITGSLACFYDISSMIHSQNINECKRIQEAFRDSEERFRSVFENAASGIALISLEGNYFMVNPSFSDMVGYSAAELSNMTFLDFTHPDDVQENVKSIRQLLDGKAVSFQSEKRYIHKDGTMVWALLNASLVKDSSGNPFYLIAQIQDITQIKKAQDELKQAKLEADLARAQAEKLALTDYLTGLYNRRAFMNRFFEEANRTLRMNTNMAVILTDIDHFKRINDTYGHKAGDIVLQAFSAALKSGCREYDFIGRYGGEEFIICLPGTDREGARQVAERMRNSIEKLEISLPESYICVHITASFGIASAKISNEKHAEKLIERADETMYQAKQQGRNRVVAAEELSP